MRHLQHKCLVISAFTMACVFIFYNALSTRSYRSRQVSRSLGTKKPINCTLEYINTVEVSQDDECLIEIIRTQFVYPPSSKQLHLTSQRTLFNSQAGQTQQILEILDNKKDGFYIESGAFDGELFSNTLYLERFLNWQGVLIEPIPRQWQKILSKNRRAWVVAAGISSTPFPQKLRFRAQHFLSKSVKESDPKSHYPEIEIQCFPLYSILRALDMQDTQFDYFSLDVEGAELEILRSIPWERINIKTLSVESGMNSDPKQPEAMELFMKDQHYHVAKLLKLSAEGRVKDYIFVRD